MNELTIPGILTGALNKGLKNLIPLLVNSILWVLTIWIPYLNVGTTIGLMVLAAKMARGEPISFTEIFNPDYRKRMGEFFLVSSFVGSGVFFGMIFMFVPAIVIGISWMFAAILVVDKGLSATDAIKKSNEYTYGKKWIIFFGQLVTSLVIGVICGVAGAILGLLTMIPILGLLIAALGGIALFTFAVAVSMGVTAQIYETLVLKSEK